MVLIFISGLEKCEKLIIKSPGVNPVSIKQIQLIHPKIDANIDSLFLKKVGRYM